MLIYLVYISLFHKYRRRIPSTLKLIQDESRLELFVSGREDRLLSARLFWLQCQARCNMDGPQEPTLESLEYRCGSQRYFDGVSDPEVGQFRVGLGR